MSNIYLFTMKRHLTSSIIWFVSLGMLIAFYASFFPIIKEGQAEFEALMAGFPEAFLDAFGMGEITALFSPSGYYAYISIFLVIAFSIYAANLLIEEYSVEKSYKIDDYLFSRPISKFQIFVGKTLAVFTYIFLLFVGLTIISIFSYSLFVDEGFIIKEFFVVNSSLFFIGIFFAITGGLIAILKKKTKLTISVSLPLVLTFYGIFFLSNLIDDEIKLTYMTPFIYLSGSYLLESKTIYTEYLIAVIIDVILIVIAYYFYQKHK